MKTVKLPPSAPSSMFYPSLRPPKPPRPVKSPRKRRPPKSPPFFARLLPTMFASVPAPPLPSKRLLLPRNKCIYETVVMLVLKKLMCWKTVL